MNLSLLVVVFCAVVAASIAAPNTRRNRDREWRFSGASGSLTGQEDQPAQSETRQFGNGEFTSHSFKSGARSDTKFDLESFVGFGKAPSKKENSARVPEETTDQEKPIIKQPIVESESSATANEGAVSAGSVSGITGGTDLGSLDLDSYAGVNEKAGYGHSSSRAVGNAAANNKAGKSRVPEETVPQGANGGDDLSVATVGASATVAKGTSDKNQGGKGDSFWDNFFVSTSRLSSGSAGESKISGSLGGFGGESGSFGITFEDKEE